VASSGARAFSRRVSGPTWQTIRASSAAVGAPGNVVVTVSMAIAA
jgi:hypothetical protein